MNHVLSLRPAPAADIAYPGHVTAFETRNTLRLAPVDHFLASEPEGCRPGQAELGLLGAFRLVVNGSPIATGSSAQRLLVNLACFGRQASRDRVAQTLWPDTPINRAHANLRATLYRLRRLCPDLVHSTKTDLRLAPDLRVDADVTRAVALTLLSIPPGEDPAVLRLVPLTELTLDLLPDWDEEWLLDHQFSYRRLRLDALDRFADLLIRQRRYGAAVQAALAVIQVDPLRETAHEALIKSYIGQGNRYDAISHYTSYRKSLRDELGLEPTTALDDLLWRRAS